jgi:hypothetical protein
MLDSICREPSRYPSRDHLSENVRGRALEEPSWCDLGCGSLVLEPPATESAGRNDQTHEHERPEYYRGPYHNSSLFGPF